MTGKMGQVFNVRWLRAIHMDIQLVDCDALVQSLIIVHGQG